MSPGQKIKARRKELKLLQKDVAKFVGVSNVTISMWENDETTPSFKNAHELSKILDMPFTEFMHVYDLDGDNTDVDKESEHALTKTPVHAVSESSSSDYAKVPVITSVQAGAWGEAADPFAPGDADDWLPCPSKHSPRTYALRVEGDSMTAAHGKSYPEGCIIFVDPDIIDVTTGDRVIAKVNGDSKVTFKVYVEDAGRKYLKPLNTPTYPMITDPFRILGKVIGKWEYE